jgi:hypothetical protein
VKSLIAKLEQAPEGSRELDTEILCLTLGGDWYVKNQYEDGSGKWLCYSRTRFTDKDKQHPTCRTAPHYTTSLDAALTLVPEGWEWAVSTGYAEIFPPDFSPSDNPNSVMVAASVRRTPALALCIAILKANKK